MLSVMFTTTKERAPRGPCRPAQAHKPCGGTAGTSGPSVGLQGQWVLLLRQRRLGAAEGFSRCAVVSGGSGHGQPLSRHHPPTAVSPPHHLCWLAAWHSCGLSTAMISPCRCSPSPPPPVPFQAAPFTLSLSLTWTSPLSTVSCKPSQGKKSIMMGTLLQGQVEKDLL